MPSMDATERWKVGLAVLTAYIGPEDRRAADIAAMVGEHDPREVLFGVLALARDLLQVLDETTGASPSQVLQTLAETRD